MKKFYGLIQLVVGIGLVLFLIRNDQLSAASFHFFVEFPLLSLGLVVFYTFCLIPLTALRWQQLLRGCRAEFGVVKLYGLTLLGSFFSCILPGMISGDAVKGMYLMREAPQIRKTPLFFSLLLDRGIGLAGYILLSLAMLPMIPQGLMTPENFRAVAVFNCTIVLVGILGLVWFFRLSPAQVAGLVERVSAWPLGHLWKRLFEVGTFLHEQPKHIPLAVGLSIVNCIGIIVCFLMIIPALGHPAPDFSGLAVVVVFGVLATALPFAPMGIGVGHVAFAYLFGIIGIQGGADIFNAFLLVQFLASMPGGLVYFYKAFAKFH